MLNVTTSLEKFDDRHQQFLLAYKVDSFFLDLILQVVLHLILEPKNAVCAICL